jgi:hypothetical protein
MMKLKLLTQEQETEIIKKVCASVSEKSMHTIGIVTGKALKEAQAKLTINEDVLARFDKVKTDLLFHFDSLAKSQIYDKYEDVIEELRRLTK